MFQAVYKLSVMVVIPVICIIREIMINKGKKKSLGLGAACSKWFVFWMIGFSALATGVMQVFVPDYTAGLLGVETSGMIIISELGFANIAMGLFALISLGKKELRRPAALTYGFYILGCTLLHITRLNEMGTGELISLGADVWMIIVVILITIIRPLRKKEKTVKKEA